MMQICFYKVEIFDKDNKLIDADTMISRDLVSIKCDVRYEKHFVFNKHGLKLKLIVFKLLNQANMIKDSYDACRLLIWIHLNQKTNISNLLLSSYFSN